MAVCSVCDAQFADDLRECPVCGAPSTAVMGALDHDDDQWESLAAGYVPPDRDRPPDDAPPPRAADIAGDPRDAQARWNEMADSMGPLDEPGAAARLRLKAGGLLRRWRRRG